jgi:hypothetical protein
LKAISAEAFFPNSPKYTPPADAPDAYKALNEMAGKWMLARAGKEAGDPLKAADVMIDLVRGKDFPLPSKLVAKLKCIR